MWTLIGKTIGSQAGGTGKQVSEIEQEFLANFPEYSCLENYPNIWVKILQKLTVAQLAMKFQPPMEREVPQVHSSSQQNAF
jgi:hypothetical protein